MNKKFLVKVKNLLIHGILEVGRFSPLTNITRRAAEYTFQYVGKSEQS